MRRLWLLALVACGSSPPAAPAAPAPAAVLVVRCAVADAALWIDDRLVGEVGRLSGGVRLPAGAHRVELRHDAHHTRYAEVTLAPGERKLLELSLPEALP
jgi:hypothetical protein